MKIRYLIALLCSLFFTDFYGMEIDQPVNPLLQVYFAPQDKTEIMNTLSVLLDNAKERVLIAMYWITDDTLTDKIIAAKKRGVDVLIVIDESVSKQVDLNYLINKFLQNNIVPVIQPSNYSDVGYMHNKFVIIDAKTVFTGSANFTKTALNPTAQGFNFENVLIINSPDIAKKYISAFVEMEELIFDFYVGIIASTNPNQLPDWMRHLVPLIYKNQLLMRQVVRESMNQLNPDQQKRIQSFFGIQSATRSEPATYKQRELLRSKGIPDEEIMGLSKQEASNLISEIIEDEKRARYYRW